MNKLQVIRKCNLTKKRNFIVGFVIGLTLTIVLPEDELFNFEQCPETVSQNPEYMDNFQPQLNLNNKPMAAKKAVKNIVRPRYYSSELGIREKLFVGVLTSQSNINTLATAFNKTVAHLVDKIKFFINADNVRSNFKLKNIVGFTDTRENLRPFHVLKYAADNYLNDFDYFLLVNDNVYLDARRLLEQLRHLSISFDVYMGHKVNGSQYCDLNSGIVLSSSAIKKIRGNLDWCVRNARSSDHSTNIGACVEYSTKIPGCYQSFQVLFNFICHTVPFDLIKCECFRELIIEAPKSTRTTFTMT